jgi:hypothetical protein
MGYYDSINSLKSKEGRYQTPLDVNETTLRGGQFTVPSNGVIELSRVPVKVYPIENDVTYIYVNNVKYSQVDSISKLTVGNLYYVDEVGARIYLKADVEAGKLVTSLPYKALGSPNRAKDINDVQDGLKLLVGIMQGFMEALKCYAGAGLELNYYGSTQLGINDGSLTMAANSTNYVYYDGISVVRNTTGFPVGVYPLATVIAGAAAITSVTDKRSWLIPAAQQVRIEVAARANLPSAGSRRGQLAFIKDEGVYVQSNGVGWQDFGGTSSANRAQITDRFPAASATGVALDGVFWVTFDRKMLDASITTATFLLLDNTATPVASAVTYDATTRKATLDPTALLADDKSPYTLKLTTGIKDYMELPLQAEITWTFSTVADLAPTSGTFEIINITPTTATINMLTPGSDFEGAVEYDVYLGASLYKSNATMPFVIGQSPNPALTADTAYTAVVKTRDTSGKTADSAPMNFTTILNTAPAASITSTNYSSSAMTVNGSVTGVGAGDSIKTIRVAYLLSGTDANADAAVTAGKFFDITAAGDFTAYQGAGYQKTSLALVEGSTYTVAVKVEENKTEGGTQWGVWTTGNTFFVPQLIYSMDFSVDTDENGVCDNLNTLKSGITTEAVYSRDTVNYVSAPSSQKITITNTLAAGFADVHLDTDPTAVVVGVPVTAGQKLKLVVKAKVEGIVGDAGAEFLSTFFDAAGAPEDTGYRIPRVHKGATSGFETLELLRIVPEGKTVMNVFSRARALAAGESITVNFDDLKVYVVDFTNTVPTAPVISYVSKTADSCTIHLGTPSTAAPSPKYDVYVDSVLKASNIAFGGNGRYIVPGLTAGAHDIYIKAANTEGSADSNTINVTI